MYSYVQHSLARARARRFRERMERLDRRSQRDMVRAQQHLLVR